MSKPLPCENAHPTEDVAGAAPAACTPSSPLAAGEEETDTSVPAPRFKGLRAGAAVLLALAVLVLFLGFIVGVPVPGMASPPKEETVQAPPPLAVELIPGKPHTLSVPQEVRTALGIRKGKAEQVTAARLPTRTRPLVLSGSTALDPNRLMRIRARFAPAEVVSIGEVADFSLPSPQGTQYRPLRSGDWVRKGQVLGVFYSVDVGSKKNDLIDALVQLRLDEEILGRAEKHSFSVPEAFILNARRNAEADRNAIDRALNTLKVWGIPREDLDAVYAEAEKISKNKGKRDRTRAEQWARVELKAPGDGIIVERNVTQHEMVVDNTVNLFQIAKVDRLTVLANAPEDDLPTLLSLSPDRKRWTVRTVGASPQEGIAGTIDEISYLIDVNQHNAVIKGHIDNPRLALRGGQFVSCTIDLPPPDDVVEVPVGAVVDDGRQCVVFVQPDPARPLFTLRRVEVTHRFEKTLFVRSRPFAKAEELTPEDQEFGLLPREPLREGQRVLTTGVLELKKELEDRESKAAEKQS
jgi:cobalt-zinc-cadmium efflux system membrane fusion protein